jgi:hypothetical protein
MSEPEDGAIPDVGTIRAALQEIHDAAQLEAGEAPPVLISRADLDVLLAVATLYIDAFAEDEMMTLPQKFRLQQVEEAVARHGRRY